MVLRCDHCDGPVVCQDGTDPDRVPDVETIWERYKCEVCGREGTLRLNQTTGETTLTGSLTSVPNTPRY